MKPFVTANGKPVEAKLPCSIEAFLVAQNSPPRNINQANVTLAVSDAGS